MLLLLPEIKLLVLCSYLLTYKISVNIYNYSSNRSFLRVLGAKDSVVTETQHTISKRRLLILGIIQSAVRNPAESLGYPVLRGAILKHSLIFRSFSPVSAG